ncbi:MAG TPA: GxxExxY protein [Chthoniobacterales bacterium]|nr:GxxExxY protein [Chthoniobacterales bacterium]
MNNHGFNRRGRGGRRASEGFDKLAERIIAAAIDVHRELGPGLLESTYELCLCRELSIRELKFVRQVPIPVEYKGVKLDCGYRADIVVQDSVIVEIKAIDSLISIHEAQLLSYLKLGGWKIGLLINFNVELLKHGIRRRVLNLPEEIKL